MEISNKTLLYSNGIGKALAKAFKKCWSSYMADLVLKTADELEKCSKTDTWVSL